MASIGQTLADARRKRKITIKDVEEAIKIRAKYISALEQDAFDQILGEAYVIGFLKTYAQWLEIDPRPLIERYREQAGAVSKATQTMSDLTVTDKREQSRKKKIVSGVVILTITILVVAKMVMTFWPVAQTGR